MDSILLAILYADLFNYPMTKEELWKFKIQNDAPPWRGYSRLASGSKLINRKNVFFFLKGREQIVELRKKREIWSQEKLKIAQRVGKWLKIIPWVKMVGITGSLAMSNSDKNDDIDLLIVSSKNRIWLTRLFITIIVELLGKRRRPQYPRNNLTIRQYNNIKNKICLNMFLDVDHLSVVPNERDLFTAHEATQMKPLWDRDEIHIKFLKENEWVKNYLPNAVVKATPLTDVDQSRGGLKKPVAGVFLIDRLEKLSEKLQLWYMRSRRTTEVISDGVIRFHPQDIRKSILSKYRDRLHSLR